MPRPGTNAPDLEVELNDGSVFRLADASPERFTMVVFFRGHFCGVCSRYLPELQANADEFAKHGVDVVLVSCDDAERSQKVRDEWGVQFPIGHSLDVKTAQEWDLFLTEGDPARPEMPEVFSEPGLYLIKPGGEIFYSSVSSAPAGRPGVADLVGWLGFMAAKNAYPQRGGYLPQ